MRVKIDSIVSKVRSRPLNLSLKHKKIKDQLNHIQVQFKYTKRIR
jgi:hypothetical protein